MAQAKKTTKKAAKKAELIVEAAPVIAPTVPTESTVTDAKPVTAPAKAGKRSTKATKEQEDKQVKQAKKAETKPAESELKKAVSPRSKLERTGKKYRQAAKLVEPDKIYSLGEATELVTKTNPAKFDATVEMHLNLGVDPKQADQNVRDIVVLPAGTGKTVRIAVLAEADDAAKAKKAGADITDADKLFAALDKQTIDFDVLIAVPAMMAKLGKYARLLGPRGLMPNPKSGTVTTNVVQAVSDAKSGKVEYRVDQAGIIHLGIGKVSFTPQQLKQNVDAVLASVRAAKPASLKNIYIKSGYLSSSMGPSIKIDIQNA